MVCVGAAAVEVKTTVVRSPVSPLDVTTEVMTVWVGSGSEVSGFDAFVEVTEGSVVGGSVVEGSVAEVIDGSEVSVGSSGADVFEDVEVSCGGGSSVVESSSSSDVTGGGTGGGLVGSSVVESSGGCVGSSSGESDGGSDGASVGTASVGSGSFVGSGNSGANQE